MAPEIFIKAYARAIPEEYQLSEEAPKIDAKNPAGTKIQILAFLATRRNLGGVSSHSTL